jgi:hypothetical protein
MKTTIQEPARDIPALNGYDLVVCGGGPYDLAVEGKGRQVAKDILSAMYGSAAVSPIWNTG